MRKGEGPERIARHARSHGQAEPADAEPADAEPAEAEAEPAEADPADAAEKVTPSMAYSMRQNRRRLLRFLLIMRICISSST